MASELKWGICRAMSEGNLIVPGKMEKYGKGAMSEKIINEKIFPKVEEWKLQPPFFIKSYWVADSNNNPPEPRYDWYVDRDYKILDIRKLAEMK